MTRSSPFVLAPLLALAFAVPAGATATTDTEGDAGRVVGLRINTQGSEEHALYHGKITVRSTKGKHADYLWGGSSCPGQKLNDGHVQLLAAAQRGRTTVAPVYTLGESGTQRCLVAFELRN